MKDIRIGFLPDGIFNYHFLPCQKVIQKGRPVNNFDFFFPKPKTLE
jgi:hypothetical protein